MKKYILHYARLNEDSETFGFETFKDLEYFVYEYSRINKGEAVYLVAKDYYTSGIYVTANPFDIEFYLTKMPGIGFKSDTFIHEYESYEEAFKVALQMKEDSPLCYSN
jgi:hypothetical protein